MCMFIPFAFSLNALLVYIVIIVYSSCIGPSYKSLRHCSKWAQQQPFFLCSTCRNSWNSHTNDSRFKTSIFFSRHPQSKETLLPLRLLRKAWTGGPCPSVHLPQVQAFSFHLPTIIRHHFVSLWVSKLVYSTSPWLLAKSLYPRHFRYLSQMCFFRCLLPPFTSTKWLYIFPLTRRGFLEHTGWT